MSPPPHAASDTPDCILLHARELVTLRGDGLGVVSDGALVSMSGRVAWVGPTADLPAAYAQAPAHVPRIDAQGASVIPGLIDAHTHVVFGGDRVADFELRTAGLSYAEIAKRGGGILTTVAATHAETDAGLRASARARLQQMLRYGVTTVECKSGYGLDLQSELRILHAVRALDDEGPQRLVPTFLGAHTVPARLRGDSNGRARYVDEVVAEMLPEVARLGLARFCDAYVEPGVAFDAADARRIAAAAQRGGLGLKLHVDQLAASGGAELAANLGCVSADHVEHTTPQGARALAAAGVVAVLLPGASLFLGGRHHADAVALRDAGVTLALATDCNPGTSPTEALPLCGMLACTAMGLRADESLRAMTVGAARALGEHDALGSLEVGKHADFVVLDAPDWRHLLWRFGPPLARRVFIGGVEAPL